MVVKTIYDVVSFFGLLLTAYILGCALIEAIRQLVVNPIVAIPSDYESLDSFERERLYYLASQKESRLECDYTQVSDWFV